MSEVEEFRREGEVRLSENEGWLREREVGVREGEV